MVTYVNHLLCAAAVRLGQLRSDESGQGLVEYALILVLVSVVAIAALTAVGVNVTSTLSNIAGDI